MTTPRRKPGSVKLLIWDLDETLWEGTLLEGDDVRLRPGVAEILAELDRRGILHSIASRNDPEAALGALEHLGVADYFLYPQIHWGAKSESVRTIAEAVNLGIDALAFIDDQDYEREEVLHAHPEVLTLRSSELSTLLDRPELTPRFVTDESRLRRGMYQAEARRKQIEASHDGPQEEFLASLAMRFRIAPAARVDLQRAEELTVRTNQLNATGYTYSYEELDRFRVSEDHLLLVASLEDRFGTYGKVGLALIEKSGDGALWILKLLLMSCRVMSRGVGSVLLAHVLERAKRAGARLVAEFRPTDRNRLMMVTYKFAGFRTVEGSGNGDRGSILLEHPLDEVPGVPDYVEMEVLEQAER